MIRDLDPATWASGPLNSQLHQGLPDKGAHLYLKKRFFKQTCSHIPPKIVSCHQLRLRATLVKVFQRAGNLEQLRREKQSTRCIPINTGKRSSPTEMRLIQFSSITSRYRSLWGGSRYCHSSWVKSTATSLKVTGLCNDTFLFQLKWSMMHKMKKMHGNLFLTMFISWQCFPKFSPTLFLGILH